MPAKPLRNLLKIPLEALWFLPLTGLYAVLFAPGDSLITLFLWVAGASLLGGIASVQPKRFRLAAAILAALLWIALWWYFGLAGALPSRLVVALLGAATALAAARQVNMSFEASFPMARWMAGMVLYVVAWTAAFFSAQPAHQNILGWMGLVYAFLMFLMINRSSIRSASFQHIEHSASLPKGLLAGNRWIVALFLLLVFAVINISWLMRAAGVAAGYLVAGIFWLINLLTPSFASIEGGGEGGGGDDLQALFEVAARERTWLDHLVEIVLTVFVAAVLLVLLALAGRVLYRLMKRALARLMGVLASYRKGIEDDYTDEFTSLADLDATARELGARVRKRIREIFTPPVRWSALTNREKVRYAFSGILKNARKRGESVDTRTPGEMLRQGQLAARDGDLAELIKGYELARYSGHDVSDEAAENARIAAGIRK